MSSVRPRPSGDSHPSDWQGQAGVRDRSVYLAFASVVYSGHSSDARRFGSREMARGCCTHYGDQPSPADAVASIEAGASRGALVDKAHCYN